MGRAAQSGQGTQAAVVIGCVLSDMLRHVASSILETVSEGLIDQVAQLSMKCGRVIQDGVVWEGRLHADERV